MKKFLIGIFVSTLVMIFVPHISAAFGDNTSAEQTQHTVTQEDLQASLLSVNAGSALLPFILILGSGGIVFLVYVNKQKKLKK